MTETKQKGKAGGRSGFNTVGAAVTGAVVGAGIAVAAAVALKDKNNQAKVKKVLTNVKNQAIDYMEGIKKQAQVKKDGAEEKLTEGKEKVKKAVNAAKDALNSK
jgi:hypothetical protein